MVAHRTTEPKPEKSDTDKILDVLDQVLRRVIALERYQRELSASIVKLLASREVP